MTTVRWTRCTNSTCVLVMPEELIPIKRFPLDKLAPHGFEYVGSCPKCGYEMVAAIQKEVFDDFADLAEYTSIKGDGYGGF
jgi:hypothetical protein